MKKLLSILGSIGMIGTAGASVVACGNGDKKEENKDSIEVAKKALKAEIDEAEGLVNTSKKEESVTNALKTAIDEAKKVSTNEKATEEGLVEAKTKLTQAIEKFNQAPDKNPAEDAKNALKAKIELAKVLVEKAEKEADAVATLKSAIEEAQEVLDEPESKEKDLIEATTDLQQAIDEYNKAKDPIEAGKVALQEQITQANELLKKGWKEETAITKLKTVNEEAKKALAKANVTEKELTEAISKLQEAIKVYNESQNSAIGDALSKLKSSIDSARMMSKLKGSSKTKAENEAYNKIIDKAQNVYDKSKDVNEIKTMASELSQATKDFAK